MKIIAGLSVLVAVSTMLADTTKDIPTFPSNSVNTFDGNVHGRINLYNGSIDDESFTGLSNANIFLGKKLGKNSRVQLNTQYGPIAMVPATSNKFSITEAFVVYNNNKTQLKAGKFYSGFGEFDPYKADKSLSESLISNLNNNSVELTYLVNPSSFVKVWVVKPANDDIKNYYGTKVGYKTLKNDIKFSFDMSILSDAREIFAAPTGVTLVKGQAYQTKLSANKGDLTLTGKWLRAPKLLDNQSARILGLAVAYDANFSGHKANIVAELERSSNMQQLQIADKKLTLSVKAPLDDNLSLIAGVSEATLDNNKVRTTSFGLQANI